MDCFFCHGDGGFVDPKTFEFTPCGACEGKGEVFAPTDEEWAVVEAQLERRTG